MASIQIPPDGLKLVCIIGMFNNNPIWRQVGKLTVTKSKGTPIVLLDPIFNAAGVHRGENNSGQVMVHAVPFSEEELSRKSDYQTKRPEPAPHAGYKVKSFDNFDDDIPF